MPHDCVAAECRHMRGKGKFGMMKESELVQEITIPALRNDLTQELFREITRQVPFLHDKDPGERTRSEICSHPAFFDSVLVQTSVNPRRLQHSLRSSRRT